MIQQLVDSANEAFRQYQDVKGSHERAKAGRKDAGTQILTRLQSGEGTMAELQGLFRQNEAYRAQEEDLALKVRNARRAAETAGRAAMSLLAKEAGLPGDFRIVAILSAEDVQMEGEPQEQASG